MANFPGGSAWSLVRDIAAGYYLVTERSFQPYNRAQLEKLRFELDRHLREVRSEQPALDDLPAVQNRNRKIQRLNTAGMILRSFRMKRKM
jgi:hypothetical protein